MGQQNVDLKDLLIRTNLEPQFYSSCRKVTQNVFTGGDKNARGRNVLAPHDVYSLLSLHVIKFDLGHLMKPGSWERGIH